MKLKAILLGMLVATVFSLGGCVDRNNNEVTSRTTTTTTTTTTTAQTTEIGTMDGEYEAGRDGIVSDNVQTTESEPDKEIGTGSIVTKDKIITTTSGNRYVVGDEAVKFASDGEAAYASSYMAGVTREDRKICWGLGKDRDSDNRPIDAVKAEEKYAELGGRFLASDGRICLTFDEGYENGFTAAILDTLKEKDVKAVFFVTYDYCRTAPELVRRMIDEGHIVGNHTWSHPSLPELTTDEAKKDVVRLHEYVREEFGYEMTLFRFPKGEFSERTLAAVNELGYTSLFWSFAYEDWDTSKHTDSAEALAKIEDSTHSGIYLLHAVSETNAQILAPLIDYWTEHGFTVGAEI